MRTYAEINLNSIENNLKEIKKIIGNKKKILLPVKADAYGHGIIEISKFVSNNKLVNMLGVASVDEALNLRENKIELPILLLGLVIPDEKTLKDAINNDIILTIADIETAKKISNISLELNKTTKIHLKIDTGMGRIGCDPSETLKIAQSLIFLKNITLDGIYTHLPIADKKDKDFTENQIELFEKIITELNLNGIKPRYIHILNSAGILNYNSELSNMVRPGIISYGYSIDKNSTLTNFKPAMTLKSKIIFTKKVKKGTPLSYGHTYTTEKESNIATISIGYGDGYSRQLSNIGNVLIDNKQYPVVGRVSMDQILIDLEDDEFEIGKDVTLFNDEEITASTIAMWTNTIPYEITCNISKRVPRIFIQNETNEKQLTEKKQKKGSKKIQKLEIFKEEETEPEIIDKIILFDADTLENAGEIIVDGDNWEYIDVDNDHMKDVTKNMKIRAVMSNLMMFNYVFDIITKPYIKK